MNESVRVTVAYILRRHGAYLINWTGPETGYATADEVYDCASSIRRAKRLAREGAEQYGYLPPFRCCSRNGARRLEVQK